MSPWFDQDCFAIRRIARSLERRFRRTGLEADKQAWLQQLQAKRALYENKEASYWSTKMLANANNSGKLWRCINDLLQRNEQSLCMQTDLSADMLSEYFQKKIATVKASTYGAELPVFRHLAKSTFNEFKTCSPEDISRIFHQFPIKSCQLDPIPANVFSRISDDLIPFIVNLCNRSFDEGILPNTQKLACVTPLLKKSGLDPSIPGNYRPVFNLFFLSKVLERVVVG